MMPENENTSPTEPTVELAPPKKKRRPSAWAVVAVGALALAAGQWVDNHNQLRDLRAQLASQGEAGQRDQENLRNAQAELGKRLGTAEGRIDEFADQTDALQAVQRELARSREEATLLEIEQAVTLASQQLQIAGNVQAAVLALQSAEVRLARLDRPQFLPLRKAVARDLEKLAALTPVDQAGISLRLEEGMAVIDKLPLVSYGRPVETAEKIVGAEEAAPLPVWRQALADFWQEVKGLVRIQRFDEAAPILLAPGQEFFLRENLKLRLLNARLALLARDQAAFRGDLKATQEALARYFVADDKAVQTLAANLKLLAAVELRGELPGLGDSLNALRTLRGGKEKP
jgi:uroporphyrin-3 C-methyltransferase